MLLLLLAVRTTARGQTVNQSPVHGAPWIDLREYGARPLSSTYNPSATGSTSKTSVTVSSNSGWQISDGLVISKAGNPTRQSIPAAPTVTPLGVVGSTTISYKCVGEDSLEGLTAASPIGSTTTGPTVFGFAPNTIRAISRSSNTVTATVSGRLPYSSRKYHAILMNVTWPSGVHDGLEYITIMSSNTFTYSQTGANESGTVGPYSAVRLANAFIITSITRTGNMITVTTDTKHDFAVGPSTYFPTIVEIAGVTPIDLDGYFIVKSVGSNTVTLLTTMSYGSQTETGSLLYGTTSNGSNNWNQMGIYSWESNNVTCPALSGTTQDYYIYAEYPDSSVFTLIGSTQPGTTIYRDWGPFLTGSYVAPVAANVPTTAPTSAQNQEYVGTVTNISGTTFTVSPTIPTNVSGQGVYHDESLAIQAADNAACSVEGGQVYFSGPANANIVLNEPQAYVANAPFNLTTIPACLNLKWIGGAPLELNDTLSVYRIMFTLNNFSSGSGYPAAGQGTYWNIGGTGNPLINALYANGAYTGLADLYMDHINISAPIGGIGVVSGGEISTFTNVFTNSNNTSVALNLEGAFNNQIENIVFDGYPSYYSNYAAPVGLLIPDGQPGAGPPIGNISANGAQLQMTGINSGDGKGIELYTTNNANLVFDDDIEDLQTLQDPQTPAVWVRGQAPISILELRAIVNDSVSTPIFANLGTNNLATLVLNGGATGGELISGAPVPTIYVANEYSESNSNIGANYSVVRQNAPQAVNSGPYGVQARGETQFKQPVMFPYLNNFPLFWEQQTSGVSATASRSGTIAAGTYSICVLPVGWNGGDGGYGLTSCAAVTLNGSQGVQINATPTPGVQGYDIYANGSRTNPSIVTSLPVTYTSSLGGWGSAPGLPGSGLPLIDHDQVATPLLRLTDRNYKLDIIAGSLAGNRSLQADAIPVGYSHRGNLLTGFHIVEDTGTLSGGALTVTLIGPAVYSSATSYNCRAQDTTTPANPVTPSYSSGSSIVFTGIGSDAFNYTCWGN